MARYSLLAAVALVALFAPSATTQDRDALPEVLFAPDGSKRLLAARICEELASAHKEVVVAIYQFTSKQIAEALAAAQRRGVKVRVLIDGGQNSEDGIFGDIMKILSPAKVPVRRVYPEGVHAKKKPSAFRPKFHHKFCVIDGWRVITGSFNWTVLADEENHENLVLFGGRALATKYVDQFDKIWRDEKITED